MSDDNDDPLVALCDACWQAAWRGMRAPDLEPFSGGECHLCLKEVPRLFYQWQKSLNNLAAMNRAQRRAERERR